RRIPARAVQELPDGPRGERWRVNEREGTSLPQCSENEQKDRNLFPVLSMTAALPPIPPAWSHILYGRPHEPASALSARMALLAVGRRLSISPTRDMLCEAARCFSAGAVRRLLAQAYGKRGLSCVTN